MIYSLFQEQSLLCFTILLLAALTITYNAIRQYIFCSANACKPIQVKAPVKDPFFGIDFIYDCLFGKMPEQYLASTHRKFQQLGNTYMVKRWTWETIYTRDSRNIKHILADAFDDFELPQSRVSSMAGLLGSGIFTHNGPAWSQARSVLRPCFAKQDKDNLLIVLERHFQALARRLPSDGTVVDLQPLFFWLTMDFATEFIMGHSTNILNRATGQDKEQQFVSDYMTCSTEIVKKMQLGPLRHFRHNCEAKKAKMRVFEYIDNLIEESFQQKKMHPSVAERDVLTELAAATHDPGELRDHILHILVASRDTTASLLSNIFFVLARSPEVYSKLRQNVISVAGTEPPTISELKQMEYLRWSIQESLRLHPVIPTNAREARRDTVLPYGGGENGEEPLMVKKGTLAMYNVYSMHRNEALFGAHPEDFIPDRWQGLRPGWGYLPFNGGPRICIGQRIALLQAQYLVARMVQTFPNMRACDNEPWIELYALATTCRDGVKIRMA